MTGDQQPPDSTTTLTQRLDIAFALKAADLGVWEMDPVTKLVNWDDRCRALFGLAKDNQLPYQQAILSIHPDDVARVDQAVQRVLAPDSGGQYDVTYRTIGADDGQLRWVRFIGKAEFTQSGEPVRFAGVAQEVSPQVLSQQKIEEVENRLQTIITNLPSATVVFRGRALVVETPSQYFIDIIGRGPHVTGKPLGELMPELESQSFLAILDEVYTSGQPFRAFGTPVEIHLDNGSTTRDYFDLIYTPLFDAQGQTYAILSVATNVTDVIKAQQQVEQSEARYRLLSAQLEEQVQQQVMIRQQLEESQLILHSMIDLAELGTYTIDLATNQLIKSPRVAAWYGLPEITDVATSLGVIQANDQERVNQAYTSALQVGSTGSYQVEYTVINPLTRQTYILQTVGQSRRNGSGQFTYVDGLVRDVTSQRQAQLALEQQVQARTKELAAINGELLSINESFVRANLALETANHDLLRSNQNLEQFAYIASHDLQEPLRKIQQFGDLLQSQYGGQLGDGAAHLERMQTAASRMSVLIRDLLAFSRISTTQVIAQPVALDQVVSQVLDTLSIVVEESGAQVVVTSLPVVPGDRSQLDQLFQNLLSNAVKFRRASPGGVLVPPQIRVKASLVAESQLPPSVHPSRYAQTYHCIEVADNGIGFEEKYVGRMFQVFQRLHGRNEFAGTGIGLAIVQKVVTNHGGAITATSEPGQGATFWVYLPA
ncbi:PAS domain-containing sensor histidine kinase [Spirosoma linguale]|uniref:histidine kinase n=1 Tax=Spirosoma linguale (strain ATCC 33905 / DSM 74 / LMG 10896 / Claus 1) TaxID=504472 RepID=D2QBY0_SPILD|nr:PAS/PAC sensor signal transduction histidine kinase [Spirosoma linguale DSM 74]